MNLTDIFSPVRVGPAKVGGYEVEVVGYVVDEEEFVALAYTESKTRCQAVWGAFHKRNQIAFSDQTRAGAHIVARRAKGKDLFQTLQGELPSSGGYVVTLLHRALLTAYFAEPPDPRSGRFQRVYVFGPPQATCPHPCWLAQLRQLILLPELPGWADIVWPAALQAGLAVAVGERAGFNPVWRLEGDETLWRALYTRLGHSRQLALPEDREPSCN